MVRHLVACAALALTAACAGQQPGPGETATPGAPRSDRTTITAAELQASGAGVSNLYDYIRTRRSDWLRVPATTLTGGNTEISVFLDRTRYGGPTSMRSISLSSVVIARRLSASEAEARYGPGSLGGAIEIFTSLDAAR